MVVPTVDCAVSDLGLVKLCIIIYSTAMWSALSSAAMKGFADASRYDMYRPSYPQEAVEDLLAKLQIKGLKNARIVDLGAGTGKFTETLADRDEAYEVMAVEPHEQMKSQLDRKHLNGIRVVKGNATDMDLETQSVDAVIVAQVWFLSYYDRTLIGAN